MGLSPLAPPRCLSPSEKGDWLGGTVSLGDTESPVPRCLSPSENGDWLGGTRSLGALRMARAAVPVPLSPLAP